MKVYGQLQYAQLEQVNGIGALLGPATKGRLVQDISGTLAVPMFYNGSAWKNLQIAQPASTTLSGPAGVPAANDITFCDAAGAAFQVILPPSASMTGRQIVVMKTDVTFNKVTLAPSGADTVNGSIAIKLCTYRESVTLLLVGTNWVIIGHRYFTGKVLYTPTSTWVSNATHTGLWWRRGDSINVMGRVVCSGAPTSATLLFNLPSGGVIDTSKMLGPASNTTELCEDAMVFDSPGDRYPCSVMYESTTAVRFRSKNVATGTFLLLDTAVTQASPFTFALADEVQFTVRDLPMVDWLGD